MADKAEPRVAGSLVSVTIPAGQKISNGVQCVNGTVARIWMPTGWDGGMLTFQLSPDGTNFYDLFRSDNTELAFNISPNTICNTTPNAFPVTSGMYMKLRSGARIGPRTQTVDRTFIVEII